MKPSKRITGIAGSLRTHSYSKAILKAIAAQLLKHRFEELDIGAIPHYNQDLDTDDAPESVRQAKEQIKASDLIILVVPEFNHGIPGVLKNTLDWLSRPVFESCFVQKPVFFVTLSEGPLGGVRAQYQMRETLAAMLCILPPVREIAISNVADKVADGVFSDAKILGRIQKTLEKDFL